MRRLLIAVVLVMAAGEGWGAGQALEIVDYRNEYLFGADASYFYSGNGSVLMRYNVADYSAADNGVDFGGTLAPMLVWIGQTAGELFIAVKDSSTATWSLYRSTDYGATAAEVLKVGWDADGWAANDNTPTHISDVELLPDSLVWDKWNSRYLVLEYNVHASGERSAGGANDQVRLMASDNGVTWTEVAHWNTDGENQNVTHGHGLFVDPYEKAVYIAFGDGADSRSGIIKWDGEAELESNQGTTSYSVALGGQERYRTVKIFFTPTHLVWGSDSSASDTEKGIWRTTKDMAAATRVYDGVPTTGQREFLYGVQTGNAMYLTEHHTDNTDRTAFIYSSTDGENWEKVARWQWQAAGEESLSPKTIFSYNEKIYIPLGSYPAGKGTYDTLVLEEQGAFTDPMPRCVHPVYWVKTAADGGNNANSGWSPTTPKLTVENILEGNKITYGARVIVGAGTFTEASILPAWDNNTYPALDSATAPVVIEGQGSGTTKIIHSDGDSATTFIEFDSVEGQKIYITDLWIDDQKTTGVKTLGFGTVSTPMDLYLERVKLSGGIATNGYLMRIAANAHLHADYSWFELTTAARHVRQNTGDANFTARYSVFVGGDRGFFQEGGQLTLLNDVLYGFGSYGFSNAATATLAPIIKNTILIGDGGATCILDAAGLTESGTDIVNNLLDDCTVQSGIANLAASNIQNIDPRFHSTSDYRLRPGSPAINAGTPVGLTTDYAGKPIAGTPDIGAYEFPTVAPPVALKPSQADKCIGGSGTLYDRLITYYNAYGCTSGTINDREDCFLTTEGYTGGNRMDRWRAYYDVKSYELGDRIRTLCGD